MMKRYINIGYLNFQIDTLFDDWNTNKDNKISWIEFREGINKWKWR